VWSQRPYPLARALFIIAKEVIMATSSSVFVGIDISMKSLGVAFFGDEKVLSFGYSSKGISPLIDLLRE
jgi:hypothetical protein